MGERLRVTDSQIEKDTKIDSLKEGKNIQKKGSWRGILKRNEERWLALAGLLVFLLIWELAPALGIIKPIFTSSPSRIVQAADWLFKHGLWYDIWVSLVEFCLGFGLAIMVAIPLGVILGWYRRVNAIFEPFVTALNAMPRVALLPLIILWLGLGIYSKVAVVFLGAVFPILINTTVGVRTVDLNLVKCARSFGAGDSQLLRTLALPTSVPFMLAGMRLGIGRGLVGVVVGELVAANAGLGHMMSRAGATFQTDKVFVGIILLTGFGYILTEILKKIEKRVETWRPVI